MKAFCVKEDKGAYLFALQMNSGETIGSVRLTRTGVMNIYPLPKVDPRRFYRKAEINQACLKGYKLQVAAEEELKRLGVKL